MYTMSIQTQTYTTPSEFNSPDIEDYETATEESPAVPIRRVKRMPLTTGRKFVGKRTTGRRSKSSSLSPVHITRNLTKRLSPPVRIRRDLSKRLNPEIRPVRINRNLTKRRGPLKSASPDYDMVRVRYANKPVKSRESSNDFDYKQLNLQELGDRYKRANQFK